MAVSLVNPGGTATSGGAYYVPAWRYLQQQQHHPRGRPTTTPPPVSLMGPGLFSVSKSRLPSDMSRDPRLWSRDDVSKWLLWCQEEFDLPPIDLSQFPMNGKALCLLMKPDFNERAPRAGDVLHNAVHLLLLNASMSEESQRQRYDQQQRMYTYTGGGLLTSEANSAPNWATAWPFVSSDYHNAGQVIHQSKFDIQSNGGAVDSTVTLSPAPSTDSQSGSPRLEDNTHINSRTDDPPEEHASNSDGLHPSGDSESSSPPPVLSQTKELQRQSRVTDGIIPGENSNSVMEQPVTNGRLLWDFLHQLLNDPSQRYSRCIAWKERDTGVFKIVDPHGLAQLWGMQKNHLNMNFDKMSRALRYYYRVNILKKVQGERHCYQFLRQPMELKACKQRALLNKYCGHQSKQVEQTTPIAIKCEGGHI